MNCSPRRWWRIYFSHFGMRVEVHARQFGHAVRLAARFCGCNPRTNPNTGGWEGVSGEPIP